jgi:hypothetical protein
MVTVSYRAELVLEVRDAVARRVAQLFERDPLARASVHRLVHGAEATRPERSHDLES